METQKNLSVKDIAQLAGTSVATVSRVLNHNGRFSKETEQRVLDVIEKYGYEPNQLARGLRAKQARTIGVLVPDLSKDFYANMTMEVQRNLLDKGYMAIIGSSDENIDNTRRFLSFLKTRKVDGLIYIGNSDLKPEISIPTVYIDRDPRDSIPDFDDYAMVECDNIQGGYLAGMELIEQGCRHICLASYPFFISTHRKRLQGFRQAMEEAGIDFPEDHIFEIFENHLDTGYNTMKMILKKHPDTDGVFMISDYLALAALKYLQRNNISVPEQIRIIGFDDIKGCRFTTPELTTIRQPIAEMARVGVERMMDILEKKPIETQRLRLPVELIRRGST